jgi:hypothetical protein
MLLSLLITLPCLAMGSVVIYLPPVTQTVRGPYHTHPSTQDARAHLPHDISLVLPLHICSEILNAVVNLVQDGVSLPEKSAGFQGLLLDLLLFAPNACIVYLLLTHGTHIHEAYCSVLAYLVTQNPFTLLLGRK